MALFRCASGSSGGGATITVTYSSDFYGETVTCSHGTKTYSKVATSSGTLEFSVDEEGTWTISCTIGSDTFSTTADVDLTYDAELVSLPNGETVLPTDDIETWLACAGIKDKSYTTLNEVLADSETFNALLGDSNACAYMKRSTTWSTDICASQYAMNLLGQYDTACDALLSDSTWASAIANSTYWESVLGYSNPIMTSNTAPSGLCFASSSRNNFAPYYAFNNVLASNGSDGNSGQCWTPQSGSANSYIGYKFTNAVVVNKINVRLGIYQPSAVSPAREFVVQGSNDTTDGTDGTWTNIATHTFDLSGKTSLVYFDEDIVFANGTAYTAYRLSCDSIIHVAGSYAYLFDEIKLYGRTTSSEKIHGGNPTYDSFYRIVDGNNVPVTDPSLLDAGTYTIYSNGLAKNPSDLSADYGKTVRICPNTKEIVVRPDNALYWWGWKGALIGVLGDTSYWRVFSENEYGKTYNTHCIEITSPNGSCCGVMNKDSISGTIYYGVKGITLGESRYGMWMLCDTNRTQTSSYGNFVNAELQTASQTVTSTNPFLGLVVDNNTSKFQVYFVYYE